MSDDDISIIGPGWADNIKLETLDAALQLNDGSASSVQANDPDNLWASVRRYADDVAGDVLEWSFATERLVNHFRCELAKFPHYAVLEYFDLDADDWLPMFDADQDGDEECRHTVLECVPAVLPPEASLPPGRHPQHGYTGHWQRCEWVCRPRRCQRMRLRLRRHERVLGPRNTLGAFVAYSLAVRNLYCGYRVDRFEMVPRPERVITSYTDHKPFATSKDVLGSSLNYSIRINRAENILHNSGGASSLVWMSEPQPFPWAVVNFYMDVRDAGGAAQTLDRFFLDPLTEGANVNLYYSNDEPAVDFPAADDTLPPGVTVINGTVPVAPLSNTTVVKGTRCYVDIDNTDICYNPRRRWWKGCHLKWKFHHRHDHEDDDLYEDDDEHPVYDCEEWHLAWTRHGLRFATRHGDYCYVDCDDFDPDDEFKCFVWFDGDETVRVRIRLHEREFENHCRLTVPFTDALISRHRFGSLFDDDSLTGDFNLLYHVLKVDEDVVEDLIEDFFRRPIVYCVKNEFTYDDTQLTKNAVLRYYPGFVSSDFPAGFKGGGPTRYDSMRWSPIARDYRLTKGFLQFPPTKAKYWKFEFCDLTPQSYEVYIPIKRTVKTYRTEMWTIPVPARDLDDILPGLLPGYLAAQGAVSVVNTFTDQNFISIGSGANPSITGVTNTMARVITNQVAASVLSAVSWAWNFMPCHRMTHIPVFETECVHTYDQIRVEQNTKIAYFVGLKSAQAYRVDYLSTDDTNQYTELFQDEVHLASDSGWILEADHSLTSGGAQFAQVQSQVLPSSRVVRAVQYATTQSEPIQLLPDDDFDDPQHLHWVSVGDGALAPTTQNQAAIGSTLRVDRSSRVQPYTGVASLYATWGAIESANLLYGALEGSGNPGQAFGGIESPGVSTPPGGRIYAAARVVAPAALTSPLYVQIVDAATDVVLSESSVTVPAGKVTEWHTSYTVGETGTLQAWRWSDFTSATRYTTISDNFSRVDAASLGSTTTGQLWQNTGTGHTISGLIAKTATAGAFDYIDGGTPWGTLSVTLGTMAGTGQGYAQLLDFRPMQVDDQGVVSYRGITAANFPTGSVFGRALLANDVVRIDVLPTAQVPSAMRDTGYPDNVSAPYSLLFWLNGTWVKTIAHRLGALTRRGILGRANQQFKAFSWAPAAYGELPGPTIVRLPVPGNGTFSADRFTWVDNDNFTWSVLGSWDNSTVANTLVATSNGAKFIVDTQYWYGTLSAYVVHVATGDPGTAAHGNVLALDYDKGIYLQADGTVRDATTNYGTLVPNGVAAGSFVQVSFLDTASVDASVRGSADPVAYPKMLVARVGGTVVGTLATTAVQGWTGTKRGLCGDVYTAAHGLPTGTSIDQLNTSFSAFDWAPDASVVYLDPTKPTWAEVGQRGTGTYDSISHHLTLLPGQLKARVIQRQPSLDIWDMDTLSLFADPIVWSFSNDGGNNFYNVYDIKNDPHGVFTFPDAVTSNTASSNTQSIPISPGQALVWRAVAYAPGSKISSLTIRPWYGGLLSGITHRVGINNGGPNVMPYDHYPPIEQDSRFQVWHDPIPQSWYYQFRIINRVAAVTAAPAPIYLVPDSLNSTYPNGN